ncbi:MAG: bifunctional 4-hydroxy-3-methylbut-2-enyl diphosphate reductase/30S ribosomal protein S1 [Christensenellales bacterium]
MVILAKNAGFCFGVRRAVEAAQNNPGERKVTLGPLIHNRHVVESLAARGVRCVKSVDEIMPGEAVVIRSHGEAPKVYETLYKKGNTVIDATCPFVKRIHKRVIEAKNNGQRVIIIGEAGHPEVDATLGWAGGAAIAVYTEKDVNSLPEINDAVVVAQTTITEEKWRHIVSLLEQKIEKVTLFMSICSATQKRQSEAALLAKKADTMIIVGGRESSNTLKLVEICKKHCKNTYHIEYKNELLLEKMSFGDIIGIVAGASTPDTIIREVFDFMIDNDKALPITDAGQADAQQPAADGKADSPDENESDGDEIAVIAKTPETALNDYENVNTADAAPPDSQSISDEAASEGDSPDNSETIGDEVKTADGDEQPAETAEATEQDEFLEGLEKVVRLKKGQIIKGTVVLVTDEDVCVNIGYKSDGVIHKNELSLNDINPKENFSAGDEIEAEVINLNDGEGNVLLSRKRIEKKQNWIKIQEKVGSGEQYKCTVKKAVKGGVTARIEGYSTFIPASHLSLKYVEDLKEFEGKEIDVMLIDSDKRQERLVASHKNVLLKEKKQKEKELWHSFKKGEVINGVVKRLTDFGAFVDIGGIDGLLHISDLAWNRVNHPSDVVTEGQELELLILNVDSEKKKIALGYKQLLPKPWSTVPEKYKAGDTVKGKVVRIVPFGAFIQLEPMIDGLVHISQITKHRLEKVEDALRLGDDIEAKVLEVNADKRKISLSIRALLPEEEHKTEVKEDSGKNEDFNYEIPPIQETKVSLADFFPKKDE